jgi:hypothetical protein
MREPKFSGTTVYALVEVVNSSVKGEESNLDIILVCL